VGLVAYGLKALRSKGFAIDTDYLTGVSIPITLAAVALGLHHLTRAISTRGKPAAHEDEFNS
jgi:uncharacterized membrane-anchored protein